MGLIKWYNLPFAAAFVFLFFDSNELPSTGFPERYVMSFFKRGLRKYSYVGSDLALSTSMSDGNHLQSVGHVLLVYKGNKKKYLIK